MSIRIRTILTIVTINLLIILFSVFAGIRYVGSNITRSQETDLTVVSDIADHFISSEIELLKLRASIVAQSLQEAEETEWLEILEYQETRFPEFIGMAVLDEETGIIISQGEMPASIEIMDDKYIQKAFLRMAFSSTYPSSVGMVFYLAAPLAADRILVLTLPGMHFSQQVSTFVIWQTGHIFMTDADGYMIANMRESWVQSRINFFRLAEENYDEFEDVAAVLARVVNGETGVGYFSMAGVPRLCSFRPVSASVEGWGMGIIAPLPESPFRDINRGLIVVAIAVFILSIIAAIIASRFVKKPFEEIAALKEEAETNSMYKSTFLANMSHEMRTPMNAIIGMTSIGKNSHEIAKKDYAFEKIEDASSHLLGVINDVLDMSKIEANKLELSHVTFNFENMFQNVVNVINFRIDERQQDFSVQIDKDIPPFIQGDDQRLAQVITNLLSNAAKFTPEKGRIYLNAKHIGEKDGFHTIHIEVIDTGIGISKEHQQKLFDPFQQAESGTSRKFGGTGLGLAISKRIVELMDGRIWIDSEEGKGSTFCFTFQAKKGFGTSESMLAPDVNINNIRIMAIDDDTEILNYISDIMQRNDIRCDVATSGEEAIAMIKKNGLYDLYFVDWKMPGMDGVELSRKIKEMGMSEISVDISTDISAYKSVVIMISAAQWDTIEREAKEAGVDKFLPKPLFPSSIINIINECLGKSGINFMKNESQQIPIENFEAYTLLLAEDVEINREILLTLLEPTNIQIECAENGREAVEKYTAEPEKYNLIFMDIHMPELDGYQATRQIRTWEKDHEINVHKKISMEFAPQTPKQQLEYPKGIPIVAMTANVFKEDIEKCLAAGMNDHLGKPLNINDVMEKLVKYLKAPLTVDQT